MSRIVVTITDGKGHARDLDLPADIPVGQLAPAVAKAIDHADLARAAPEIKYVLKHQATGQIVPPDRTLASAGVLHGEVLTLMVRALPHSLVGSAAPRSFSGPGFVSSRGLAFPFRRSNTTIGRADPGSGVVEALLGVDLTELDDPQSPSVSRRHAQILYRNAAYVLHDLKSTNGTRVNGEALGPGVRRQLQHGDEVEFGDVQLTFIWDSQE